MYRILLICFMPTPYSLNTLIIKGRTDEWSLKLIAYFYYYYYLLLLLSLLLLLLLICANTFLITKRDLLFFKINYFTRFHEPCRQLQHCLLRP